jgi:RHS repeat-associated protein
MPFRFTGKELDPETGLYYYGARYLDPRTSRWLSADPAMGEYIPQAPVNDEARRYNKNLPGMGGVFNIINLHTYRYAGNNPIRITDPDGRSDIVIFDASDLINKKGLGIKDYANVVAYDLLVDNNFDKIEEVAALKDLTIKIISGADATMENLLAAYSDNETKRLIIVAHSINEGEMLWDNFRDRIAVSQFDSSMKGKNLEMIDLVTCFGENMGQNLANAAGVKVNTYNREGKKITFYGTNAAMRMHIRDSILLDRNTAIRTFFPR